MAGFPIIKHLLATERRDTIERFVRDRVRSATMPGGLTLARVLGEHPMVVDLRDLSVAPHLTLDGYWELWLSMCLARNLKPGWKCIDVGANFGYFTLLMALLTGAEVEAWEPYGDLTTMLRLTLSMNGLSDRVSVVDRAASGAEGVVEIYRSKHNWGSATLRPSFRKGRSGEELEPMRVMTSRIDVETKLDRVDFVKIDAEGSEEAVWRGMQLLFSKQEPLAMLMEWTPSMYEDAKGFLHAIEREGFSVSLIDQDGKLQKPVGDITAIEGHLDLWLSR